MSTKVDPFDSRYLSTLIRSVRAKGSIDVSTREGKTKEFKEKFSWGSVGEYARTLAAFGNAGGGYIIFGVTDNPRKLVGLEGGSLTQFDNLDQARFTEYLNELFSPEIHWKATTYEVVNGKTVGLIYSHESEMKPIVARKTLQKGKILEGDIVFRYNSRNERIKYPELRQLLDESKAREQRQLMRLMDALARAGAPNAAVLDFNSSTLQGPSGQRVLIDRELLDQISFIREGEFDEVAGAQTLKVVGDLHAATDVAFVQAGVVKSTLLTEDVLMDFFRQAIVSNPKDYIRVVATGSSSFLPVQFFRDQANLSKDELIEYVSGINTRSISKKKLLGRLESDDRALLSPPTTSSQHASTVERRAFWTELARGNVDIAAIVDARKAQYFAESVKSLADEQIAAIFEPLLNALEFIFNTYYEDNGKVADGVRRAACRIDLAKFTTPNAEMSSE